jgi:kynurenine 3-monooxygenase
LGTVRCNRWTFENSIALMGDAAHAIVPFFGQGMNCGFEDCTTLLELHEKHSGNWSQILTDFEKKQKPNADAIADMALENWVEMKEKVGDSRFLLRKKVEAALEQKYPGVFKSRYGLITYTLTSYALAQKAGQKQNQIIDRLIDGVDSVDNVSWEKADALIQTEWMKFVNENSLNIEVYPKSKA